MGVGHFHSHSPKGRGQTGTRRLKLALALTVAYMIAEAVGGWFSNSLALLADAGHMLTDAGALALTLSAAWLAARPATPEKTYGYYRLEILAAFINGILLALIALSIVYEAFERFGSPTEVDGLKMTAIATGGLFVNLICAKLLSHSHEHDLNMRAARLHVLSDALGSIAAIFAGTVIVLFGWYWADAASSMLISVVIVYSAWRIISDSVHILLEGTPSHVNVRAVQEAIASTTGVSDVHDLHVWSISSGMVAVSAHVRHSNGTSANKILAEIRAMMHDRFEVDHLTIQMEQEDFVDEMGHMCSTCETVPVDASEETSLDGRTA